MGRTVRESRRPKKACPNPVRVGSRVRGHFRLLAWEPLDGGAQLVTEVSVELEGSAKPACVAESVSRRFL